MTMEELRERYTRFCEEHEGMEKTQVKVDFVNKIARTLEEWFALIDLLED